MLEIFLALFQWHRIGSLEAEMEALRQQVNQVVIEEVIDPELVDRSQTLLCQEYMIAQLQTLLNKHIAQQLSLIHI